MNNYISKKFSDLFLLFQKNLFLRKLKVIFYYIDGIMLPFLPKAKYIKEKKKKVLVLYNQFLGDAVIWRCSSIHLRELYPRNKYKITLLCQKGLNKIYEIDGIYDEIIQIDFNKSTFNLLERFKNYKILRNTYYDILIDPVGVSEWLTNIFYTRMILSKEKYGVRDINLISYCNLKKVNKIYSKIIEIEENNLHLIEYYSEFLCKLTNKKINVGLEKFKTTPNKFSLPKKYYIIFPGASTSLKRWNLEKYAMLSKKIYDKTKMKLVLLGTSSDKEVIDKFKKLLNVPYIDLFNKTNLNDYIDIITKSSLVITNDTSAYHIAVMQQTPVVIISGLYTYHRYMLYNFKRMNEFKKPILVIDKRKCMDCYNRCVYLKKSNENWPCLESITVDDAWEKIKNIL